MTIKTRYQSGDGDKQTDWRSLTPIMRHVLAGTGAGSTRTYQALASRRLYVITDICRPSTGYLTERGDELLAWARSAGKLQERPR